MKWGVFSLSQIPDQSKRVASFDADLRLFELAEELGYDKVCGSTPRSPRTSSPARRAWCRATS
jgi:hypothetical protein